MTGTGKHLIRDLAVTGIAAPFVVFLLIVVRAAKFLPWIVMPILYLGQAMTALIARVFLPQGGGELVGLGISLVVDFVLAWIVVWIVLFALLKLLQKCMNRKKREA